MTWGDRLFITSAATDGSVRYLTCINRNTGKQVWEKPIAWAAPENVHRMNSWATPSCATDGERVIAFFGPAGLHCYDMDGNHQWTQNLGTFPGAWGIAASPIIHEDLVIQNCDAEGPSYLIALDKKTGKTVWKTNRLDKPKGGWSTPIIINTGKRLELILNGEFGVKGYDPNTGKELWFCKSFNGRGTPVPDFSMGQLYVVNGKPGDTYCVRPGGSGDVTKTHMAWHAPRARGGRDLPSPIAVNGFVYVITMDRRITSIHASSGKILFSEKLDRGPGFSASPIQANGMIYLQDESGVTYVIRPGSKLDVVAANSLGDTTNEIFRASITPVDGKLYIRSASFLYCVGSRTAE